MTTKDNRQNILEDWLFKIRNGEAYELSLASADASFRRYFRLQSAAQSYIVMDAPPEKENIGSFLAVSNSLRSQGVHAPEVFAHDETLGFILLEDLGSTAYLDTLRDNPDDLYEDALQALVKIQRGVLDQPTTSYPDYNHNRLDTELNVFEEWYLNKHLGFEMNASQKTLWRSTKEQLIETCLAQPQVWVHRDYHSRNLMLCPADSPGVIDYQDLVVGPISYDVVSLFKDCYIEWPRGRQLKWCRQYLQLCADQIPEIPISDEEFTRWYDFTGLQRHLKVLGVFCRLNYRDNKSGYLNDLPLVRKYVDEALCLYPELDQFKHFYQQLSHV